GPWPGTKCCVTRTWSFWATARPRSSGESWREVFGALRREDAGRASQHLCLRPGCLNRPALPLRRDGAVGPVACAADRRDQRIPFLPVGLAHGRPVHRERRAGPDTLRVFSGKGRRLAAAQRRLPRMLTLYVDADACPVKEEVYKVARRY